MARPYNVVDFVFAASDMLSWRNDKRCGQWLVLHVPFRNAHDLMDANVLERVPKQHLYLGGALYCRHSVAQRFWHNMDLVHEEMRQEGHSRKYIVDIMEQLVADISLVGKYMSGEL